VHAGGAVAQPEGPGKGVNRGYEQTIALRRFGRYLSRQSHFLGVEFGAPRPLPF
jgi:hypothetical protein